MSRSIHAFMGLIFAPLLIVLALSGVVLAWHPLTISSPMEGSISDALRRIENLNGVYEIDKLERSPAGQLMLHHYRDGKLVKDHLDVTGIVPLKIASGVERTAKTLHREFFIGNKGRVLTGTLAAVMAVMCVTGFILMLRRSGGFGGLFKPAYGSGAGRTHALVGQLCILPLLVMALSGIWLCLSAFGIISDGAPRLGDIPSSTQVDALPLPSNLTVFERPLSDLKSLVFPIDADWFDVFVLETKAELIIIDQANGTVIDRRILPLPYRISQLMYKLHSGEGMRIWAGVLAICALAIPAFTVTGGLVWLKRPRKPVSEGVGELMIFVGSENGSTWEFAKSLFIVMKRAGEDVGIASLNAIGKMEKTTKRALILTSTYGNGDAPQNAGQALDQIKKLSCPIKFAVLGFGDRQFSSFCSYAFSIQRTFSELNHHEILPFDTINQKCPQAFSQWTEKLGHALCLPLTVPKIDVANKSRVMTVKDIRHYKDKAGRTSLIRLKPNGRKLRYSTGDLVQLAPRDGAEPRHYSIASPRRSQTLDLLVREHMQGHCSPILCRAERGSKIRLTHQKHSFRMPSSGPVVMIATGTGIAPFIGMISETKNRKITLFWGHRYIKNDFPFMNELACWQANKRVAFYPAFSNVTPAQRVQDLMRIHASIISDDIIGGEGTVMICGSLAAAHDIRAVLFEIFSTSSITPEDLKRQKRFLEDVY